MTATEAVAARYLLADIGGTNARFGLFEPGARPGPIETYATKDYPNLSAAAVEFLRRNDGGGAPVGAAIAVASPVTGDRIALTNTDWSFSIEALKGEFGIAAIHVLNDFEALAHAVPALDTADMRKVGGGTAADGAPVAVIGPGTGLGIAGLVVHDGVWTAVATEGGHVTLPAQTPDEDAILARLRAEFGHVSAERAVSGPGLVNLYRALSAVRGEPADELRPGDVTAGAVAGGPGCCSAAVDMFVEMLGTVAGNLALTLGARGGIYIAGGIVPRLPENLFDERFRARFEAKGRFADYLAAIPTFVITHPNPAFLGLARVVEEQRAARPPG